MLLIDTGISHIRNEYLIPRTGFSVDFNKIKYWTIKDVIVKYLKSIKKINDKSFEIEIPKEFFLKAINCEIDLFYTKAQVQMMHIKNATYTVGCWPYVSAYYWLFYNATVLQRNFYRGMLSFDGTTAQQITDIGIALIDDIIKFPPGSYFFSASFNEYDHVVLNLNAKKDFHKSTWSQMPLIIREINSHASKDELLILDNINFLFDKFNYNFPSQIRNDLNYKYDTALYDLNKDIDSFPVPIVNEKYTSDFLKKVAKYNGNQNNLQFKIDCSLYLGSYFQHINNYLQNEFINRSQYGKQFHKKRELIGCM